MLCESFLSMSLSLINIDEQKNKKSPHGIDCGIEKDRLYN